MVISFTPRSRYVTLHEILPVFVNTFQVTGLTYQIGWSGVVKPAFQANGVLNNSVDPQFRAIDVNWPTGAFAHDLGTVLTTKSAPVVYVVGYVREPLVQLWNLPNANNLRGPYYLTRYNSDTDMVCQLCTLYTISANATLHRSQRSSMITQTPWRAQQNLIIT